MTEDLLRNYQTAFSMLSNHEDTQIFVLEADEQDCQKLYSFLRTGPYLVEIENDEQRVLPEQVEEFRTLYSTPRGYLYTTWLHPPIRIDKEGLDIHFYCFGKQAFEFDLDHRRFQHETTNEEHIARLHEFIHSIGHLLNKVIVLTPQALIEAPLYRFDPKTGEEHWFLSAL